MCPYFYYQIIPQEHDSILPRIDRETPVSKCSGELSTLKMFIATLSAFLLLDHTVTSNNTIYKLDAIKLVQQHTRSP